MLHGYLSQPLWQCHHKQTPLGLQKLRCLFALEEGIHCRGYRTQLRCLLCGRIINQLFNSYTDGLVTCQVILSLTLLNCVRRNTR